MFKISNKLCMYNEFGKSWRENVPASFPTHMDYLMNKEIKGKFEGAFFKDYYTITNDMCKTRIKDK